MSNTCSVSTIISLQHDLSLDSQERVMAQKELDDLYLKMQNVHDLPGLLAEVYPDAASFRVDARSSFCGEPCLYENPSRIVIEEETAWDDKTEAWNLILKHYPLLKRYYQAYEPGCELFQTNDESGLFFPTEYRIDASVPDWAAVFPEGKPIDGDGECVFEDFWNETDLLEWIQLHTGLNCKTVSEARAKIPDCLSADDFFCIYSVDIVPD